MMVIEVIDLLPHGVSRIFCVGEDRYQSMHIMLQIKGSATKLFSSPLIQVLRLRENRLRLFAYSMNKGQVQNNYGV